MVISKHAKWPWSPGVHTWAQSENELARLAVSRSISFRAVGSTITSRSLKSLLADFARSLELPDYFGGTLDSLVDALLDVSMPAKGAIALLIRRASQLPAEERARLIEALTSIVNASTKQNSSFYFFLGH